MAAIKVYYDQTGHTLTVWFGDPSKEAIAQDIGDDMVVMKSEGGDVLGFEKLNVNLLGSEKIAFEFERTSSDLATI
ncbi:MAG TPA: DUF2283 domain-containing protein [Candidatus Kapabacteria bacterium]|jgi:hypothetical protein|nr:DUF2283 domain-containing protein [Candidatus Kapabacteria bacterium]